MTNKNLRETTKWVLAEYGTDDRLTEEVLQRGDKHIEQYAREKQLEVLERIEKNFIRLKCKSLYSVMEQDVLNEVATIRKQLEEGRKSNGRIKK